MLTIEEYIAKRKKEDKLNEFDFGSRNQNLKICVDYIFEYFNNYIGITAAEEQTMLHDEKLDRSRKQLIDYEPEVRDWLVDIYNERGKYLNVHITKIIKGYDLFFLYDSDTEFRSLSYDCYSQLIKRFSFLRDKAEMLFLFIKDYHRVRNQFRINFGIPSISVEIDDWVETTWVKHNVSLLAFAQEYTECFYDNTNIWPVNHKIKSLDPYLDYEYDYKQKSNLFNIDSLYRKMPKKSFIKLRKQELEILLMYYWLHSIDSDKDYWDEYINKVLPSLNT